MATVVDRLLVLTVTVASPKAAGEEIHDADVGDYEMRSWWSRIRETKKRLLQWDGASGDFG